jgi:hypothetical protein
MADFVAVGVKMLLMFAGGDRQDKSGEGTDAVITNE